MKTWYRKKTAAAAVRDIRTELRDVTSGAEKMVSGYYGKNHKQHVKQAASELGKFGLKIKSRK